MAGYTKLFSSIVTSTIWREDDKTRLVWITMLALADKFGTVNASVPGLADAARVSLDECAAALRRLSEPDEWSRTRDHEGRRITEIDGGWVLLNYDKYRAKADEDERREQVRQAVARHRARAKTAVIESNQGNQSVTESNQGNQSVTESNGSKHKQRAEAYAEGSGSVLSTSKDLPLAPSSAEPDSTPARLTFGCAGKVKTWNLTELRVNEWRSAFPALDVEGECRKALAWVNASPRNRKTAQGMAKFLFAWLSRAQDRGRANGTPPPKPAEPPSPYCGPHSRGFRGRVSSEPKSTCPECKHVRALGLTRESEMASVASLLPGYGTGAT